MASPHHLASASADADPPLVPPTVPPRRRFKMKAQRWKSPHGSLPARRKRPPENSVSEESSGMKTKIRVPNPGSTFEHGTEVEVTSDEEGFRGAWFTATIVGPAGQDSLMVQYLKLVTDDGSAPLREIAKMQHVRPNPPCLNLDCAFKQFDKVDAWFNEGWWEGVVLEVLDGSKYVVYFSYSCESMVIEHSELRPHQDWVDGKWIKDQCFDCVSILIYDTQGQSMELNIDGQDGTVKFIKGTQVEVKNNKIGSSGAWFPATIVHVVGNDKYLVQYCSLVAHDGTFREEEASASDIRPSPPFFQRYGPYEIFEVVDVYRNGGWIVGRIMQVEKDMRYTVQFSFTEKLEFGHDELRSHQEWIEGNWITVYKDYKVCIDRLS
ncbi:hypothetical protein Tsubulata_040500 [Turnera subulata]|uniref:Agenet domain-containing protein n=1 Tax=Turnera subulata TaxID=218843 RepID=A0A9Q0J522_9ROSI|nr:hypothetical protein Tsubulata_040500 [Turnera subulata]